MDKKDNKQERPVSYPRPTETDNQLKNQPEFIDQQPNDNEREISGLPEKENEEQV